MSTKYAKILAQFGTPIEESCGARKRLAGCEVVAGAYHIPVDRISPDPEQPRKEFDDFELRSLAESLRLKGQIQPIRVRYVADDDRFLVVCGERRWRAAKLAGLPTLTAIIDDADDARLETQLIENLVRAALSPIEEAQAFKALIDKHGWTARALAERVNVHESKVSRALALLELPGDIQQKVDAGEVRGKAVREMIRHHVPKRNGQPAKQKPGKLKEESLAVESGRVVIQLRKAGDLAAIETALEQALEAVRAKRSTAAAA